MPAFVNRLLDIVYPRRCCVCGDNPGRDSNYICWDCRSSFIPVTDPFCSKCGDPVSGEVKGSWQCSYCNSQPPCYDIARSAFRYHSALGEILKGFKYGNMTYLASDLSSFLEAALKVHYCGEHFDCIVPVPVHRSREVERSYNQSSLLAAKLAARTGISFLSKAVDRTLPTRSQTGLTARDRRKNVKGAFKVAMPEWIKARNILVVDDIMTTGSTVNEVSRVLKQAGAGNVHVITVARG